MKLILLTFGLALASVAGAADVTPTPPEPCMDAAVSPSGSFDSALLEQAGPIRSDARSHDRFLLFAVGASYLDEPFEPVEPAALPPTQP